MAGWQAGNLQNLTEKQKSLLQQSHQLAKTKNAKRGEGLLGPLFGGPRMGAESNLQQEAAVGLIEEQSQIAIDRAIFNGCAPALIFTAKAFKADLVVLEAAEEILSRLDKSMHDHARERLAMATNSYIYASKVAATAGMEANAATAVKRGILGAILQTATGAVSGFAVGGPWGAALGAVCAATSSVTQVGISHQRNMAYIEHERSVAVTLLINDAGAAARAQSAVCASSNARLHRAEVQFIEAKKVSDAAAALTVAATPLLKEARAAQLAAIKEKGAATKEVSNAVAAAAKIALNERVAKLRINDAALKEKEAALEKRKRNLEDARIKNVAAEEAQKKLESQYGADVVAIQKMQSAMIEAAQTLTNADKANFVAIDRLDISAAEKVDRLGIKMLEIVKRNAELRQMAVNQQQVVPLQGPFLGAGGAGAPRGGALTKYKGGVNRSKVSVPPMFELILINLGLDRTIAGLAMGMINGPDNLKRGIDQFIPMFIPSRNVELRQMAANQQQVVPLQGPFLGGGGSNNKITRKIRKSRNNKSRRS
jgi:hypothetical protein